MSNNKPCAGTNLATDNNEIPCDGVYYSTECVVHPNALVELTVPENSTLDTVITAFLNAIINLNNRVDEGFEDDGIEVQNNGSVVLNETQKINFLNNISASIDGTDPEKINVSVDLPTYSITLDGSNILRLLEDGSPISTVDLTPLITVVDSNITNGSINPVEGGAIFNALSSKFNHDGSTPASGDFDMGGNNIDNLGTLNFNAGSDLIGFDDLIPSSAGSTNLGADDKSLNQIWSSRYIIPRTDTNFWIHSIDGSNNLIWGQGASGSSALSALYSLNSSGTPAVGTDLITKSFADSNYLTSQGAVDVSITDSGNYFTSTNVEGSLQELGLLDTGNFKHDGSVQATGDFDLGGNNIDDVGTITSYGSSSTTIMNTNGFSVQGNPNTTESSSLTESSLNFFKEVDDGTTILTRSYFRFFTRETTLTTGEEKLRILGGDNSVATGDPELHVATFFGRVKGEAPQDSDDFVTKGFADANYSGGGSADGTETIVTAGTNVTVTGDGSSGDPYVINSLGGASADNLGNHVATQDLDMDNNSITNVNSVNTDVLQAFQELLIPVTTGAPSIIGNIEVNTSVNKYQAGNFTSDGTLNFATEEWVTPQLQIDDSGFSTNLPSDGSIVLLQDLADAVDGLNISGSGADNLGNHTATQDLDMDGNNIVGADDIQAGSINLGTGVTDLRMLNIRGTASQPRIYLEGTDETTYPGIEVSINDNAKVILRGARQGTDGAEWQIYNEADGGVITKKWSFTEDDFIAYTNGNIKGISDPVDDQDAATKAYVDANSGGGTGTTEVEYAEPTGTSDITLTNTDFKSATGEKMFNLYSTSRDIIFPAGVTDKTRAAFKADETGITVNLKPDTGQVFEGTAFNSSGDYVKIQPNQYIELSGLQSANVGRKETGVFYVESDGLIVDSTVYPDNMLTEANAANIDNQDLSLGSWHSNFTINADRELVAVADGTGGNPNAIRFTKFSTSTATFESVDFDLTDLVGYPSSGTGSYTFTCDIKKTGPGNVYLRAGGSPTSGVLSLTSSYSTHSVTFSDIADTEKLWVRVGEAAGEGGDLVVTFTNVRVIQN